MSFAALQYGVVHYRDSGRRDAPAIVFVNSLGTDLRIWQGVVERLAGDYRCVTYDKRGHGLSSVPPHARGFHWCKQIAAANRSWFSGSRAARSSTTRRCWARASKDIIKASREHTAQVIETTGRQPEEIRILDFLRKEGIALPIDQEGANANRT